MDTPALDTWLRKRRLKCPDKVALVFGEERILYRQLADEADLISALLRQMGVSRGDRVAYLGENSPDFVKVLFGTVQLGAVFVPVNTRLAQPEIQHVLSDSGARVLIHDPEFSDRLQPSDAIISIRTGAGTEVSPGLNRLLADVDSTPNDAPLRVELSDPAAIIYTSGTTGRPKGAVLTHGNLTWVSINAIIEYDMVSSDIALMISPLFHVASLGMGALPIVLKGGTIVLEKGFDAGRALAQIERHRVTMVSGVPTTFQLMADHPAWANTDLSSLTTLTCGGSAVPTRILNAYEDRSLSFTQGYGMTETSPGATCLTPAMTREKQGSVGLAMFFMDVRIGSDTRQPVSPGTPGEIEITGTNVFLGYHGLTDETTSAFTEDGWLRSGDIGYVDDDGYLFISDRIKDMIISGGENIYPAEIEQLIGDIEGITGVAVIGVPDDRWGEVPIAIVTVREDAVVDTDRVRTALTGSVARYKIPKDVVVVAELPRTASGKVRKAELRQNYGRSQNLAQ